ncbi:MAG: EpsG family protein [Acinetobacter pittii]|nr:EpsG family protein [Vagococcus sp.]MDR3039338.1 EpsG family protein [Acinetobacter pittii]
MPISIYHLLLLSSVICILFSNKNTIKFSFILSITFILYYSYISGWRDIGVDTNNYLEIFKSINIFSFRLYPFSYINDIEVGFNNLIYIGKNLGLSFELFSFLLTITILLDYFISSYKVTNVINASIFILLIMLTYTSYQLTFNQVRQGLAVMIAFSAFMAIIQRKSIKAFSLIIFASLFHSSAIFLVLFIFLTKIKIKNNTLLLLAILSPLATFLHILENLILYSIELNIFNKEIIRKLNFYLLNPEFNKPASLNLSLLLSYFGIIALGLVIKNKKLNTHSDLVLSSSYKILVIGYFVYFLSFDFVVFSQRLLYYFDILYCFIISRLVFLNIKNTTFLFLFSSGLFLFSIKTIFYSVSWDIS